MPCFAVLIAFFFPRLLLIGLWLFSTYLHRAYDSIIWPVLGFFFMPVTTLAYAWAINTNGSVSGLYFAVVLIGALIDLGAIGGSSQAERKRRRRRK